MHPKHLFNTGTTNTAVLTTNHGDEGAYVNGFLSAAHHLATRLAKNQGPIDIEIYPALYLYRHGLELGFKRLLGTYHYEFEHEDKTFHGHILEKLWAELQPRMEPLYTPCDEAEHFSREAIDYISECVRVIHEVDPTGEHARYVEDLQGRQTMKSVRTVNLEIFVDMCSLTADWMTSVLFYREEVDNHLRHQRGFFDLPAKPLP